ncbi:alpha/beta hydrolase [Burkholderia stagnalis]
MTDNFSPYTLALQRAMPLTRLLDCGMDYADATALHARTAAGERWDVAAEALAEAQLARAAQAADAGHLATAADAQAMAIADLLFAQMAFNDDAPRKRQLYARVSAAALRLADWSALRIERIALPFAAAHLVGWAVRPASVPLRGTVIVFGGQSGWGFAYWPIARALAARGLATLLAEGPGQGETRLEQRIFVDVDVTAAYRRFVDHVAGDASLGPVGIWGNSIGGLWAASAAASDRRIAACCVNGALAAPTLLPFRTFVEQAAAMLGNADPDAISANFARMRFAPERDRIACPLLVLHGGEDPLIRLDDQQPFLDAATSGDATLEVWPDGDHTIYNHSAERTAFACDWFVDRLARAAGA